MLPGGGCSEALVAAHIRLRAASLSSPLTRSGAGPASLMVRQQLPKPEPLITPLAFQLMMPSVLPPCGSWVSSFPSASSRSIQSPVPHQARAAEHVAAALESAAALLVQPLADRREATEAILSLATHVQQQVAPHSCSSGSTSDGPPPPRRDPGSIDYVGWNSLAGQFETVAQGRLVPSCASAADLLTWVATGRPPPPPPPRLADVASEGAVLLEVGAVKLGAISAGLDAACMLLRIDGCITAASGS